MAVDADAIAVANSTQGQPPQLDLSASSSSHSKLSSVAQASRMSKRVFMDAPASDEHPHDLFPFGSMQAVVNIAGEDVLVGDQKHDDRAQPAFFDSSTDADEGEGVNRYRFTQFWNSELARGPGSSVSKFSLKPAVFSPAPANIPIADKSLDSGDWSDDSASSDSDDEYIQSRLRGSYASPDVPTSSQDAAAQLGLFGDDEEPLGPPLNRGNDDSDMNGQNASVVSSEARRRSLSYVASPYDGRSPGLSHQPPDPSSEDDSTFMASLSAPSSPSTEVISSPIRISQSSPGPASENSSPRISLPHQPSISLASQSNSPLTCSPNTSRKRKRKMVQSQRVASAHYRAEAHSAATTAQPAKSLGASGMDVIATSGKPIITYRLRTVDSENGTVHMIMKEDYMANFIESREKMSGKQDNDKGKGKLAEPSLALDDGPTLTRTVVFEASKDPNSPLGSVRTITSKSQSVAISKCKTAGRLPYDMPVALDDISSFQGGVEPVLSKPARRRKSTTAQKAELKAEQKRQKLREIEEKARMAKEAKEKKVREKAATQVAKAERRLVRAEERKQARREKKIKEMQILEYAQMEKTQKQNEMMELMALREKLFHDETAHQQHNETDANTLQPTPIPSIQSQTISKHEHCSKASTRRERLWWEEERARQKATWEAEKAAKAQILGKEVESILNVSGDDSATSSNNAITQGLPEEIIRQKFALLSALGMYSADATWEFKELGGDVENIAIVHNANESQSA